MQSGIPRRRVSPQRFSFVSRPIVRVAMVAAARDSGYGRAGATKHLGRAPSRASNVLLLPLARLAERVLARALEVTAAPLRVLLVRHLRLIAANLRLRRPGAAAGRLHVALRL